MCLFVFVFIYFIYQFFIVINTLLKQFLINVLNVFVTLNQHLTFVGTTLIHLFCLVILLHLQEVGCDRQLASGAKEDHCGVCGGDGTTCRLLRGQALPHLTPDQCGYLTTK